MTIPDIPQEIKTAYEDKKLVLFIGAGVSRLVGYPDWDGFSNQVLEKLANSNQCKEINFSTIDVIKNFDPRKRLSIVKNFCKPEYFNDIINDIFDIEIYRKNKQEKKDKYNIDNDIYDFLGEFNCKFVTTNYDHCISNTKLDEQRSTIEEFKSDIANFLKRGVVHIHGHIKSEKKVITIIDYLKSYEINNEKQNPLRNFLSELFRDYTILFIGYGLEETEILQSLKIYEDDNIRNNLFILQGFYKYQDNLKELMEIYYNSLNIKMIDYCLDDKGYHVLTDIIQDWSDKIQSPYIIQGSDKIQSPYPKKTLREADKLLNIIKKIENYE